MDMSNNYVVLRSPAETATEPERRHGGLNASVHQARLRGKGQIDVGPIDYPAHVRWVPPCAFTKADRTEYKTRKKEVAAAVEARRALLKERIEAQEKRRWDRYRRLIYGGELGKQFRTDKAGDPDRFRRVRQTIRTMREDSIEVLSRSDL